MIALFHPRSTRPKNRRFPLSVLSLAAMLEGKEEYEIVDGNLDTDPFASLDRVMREKPARALAVSVMPGPQMVAAVDTTRKFHAAYPYVPVIWGGYFPSLFPDTTLKAPYVDFVVRGQGEDTLTELLAALDSGPTAWRSIDGLSFRDDFGLTVSTRDRAIKSPGDYPQMPYHRLRDAHLYPARTFLGDRTAVHQASFGCPFRCSFCGVTELAGGRQKGERPERTAAILAHLKREYAIDSIQFYDNNFFLREDDAAELAERMAPLGLQWWCEGRIDIVLRYSDATWRALRKSGCRMIFFGAESGDDQVLREMNKQLSSEETLALASRIREFGIVPEFSFVIGNPKDPARDLATNMRFIREVKRRNPDSEIIVQHYTPVPHPDGMYGVDDGALPFPKSPDEWAREDWAKFAERKNPSLPWLPKEVRRKIDAFELVLACRWPTVQDTKMQSWARALLRVLGSWRYAFSRYEWPWELRLARRLLKPREPKVESI